MKKQKNLIHLISACLTMVAILTATGSVARAGVLYDNGPFITHAAACSSGDATYDASRCQQNLGMNCSNWSDWSDYDYRVSDNFTVPAGKNWEINIIQFYIWILTAAPYPTTPSPVTAVYLQIWDGPPEQPGSSVVWGDLTTNRLTSSAFSGAIRDFTGNLCSVNFIYTNTATLGISLGQGSYWLDWTTDVTDPVYEPRAIPITILGQTSTGDALKKESGYWGAIKDQGTGNPQGLPFKMGGTQCTDNDDDGYGAGCPTLPDCNDNDATINPGMAEICNGIDDNCNGQTDEGVSTTYYYDSDSDGYGSAAHTTLACSPPAGYVSSVDCNDTDPAVHPGAAEVCNYIDDNCNGSIDEGVSETTYYADADSDGYGDPGVTVPGCSSGPPQAAVANSSDCNDNNSAIHPGAAEVCNHIDDNCNGSIDEGVSENTYYADADSDSYGAAAVSTQACTAPAGYVTDAADCDDTNPAVHDNCTNCTLELNPGSISKLVSFLLPVRRIVLEAHDGAAFVEAPLIDWGTDSIETLSAKLKNGTTIICWVRIKPRLLELNETYTVTAGACSGALTVRGF